MMNRESWNEDALVAEYLYEQCSNNKWLDAVHSPAPSAVGVAVQNSYKDYTFLPTSVSDDLMHATNSLGFTFLISMSSNIVSAALARISQQQAGLTLHGRNYTLPVVESLVDIDMRVTELRKNPACLVRREGLVLVWADDVEEVISAGDDVEKMLMENIWGQSFGSPRTSRPGTIIRSSSSVKLGSPMMTPAPMPSMPSSQSMPMMSPALRAATPLAFPTMPSSRSMPSMPSSPLPYLNMKKEPVAEVKEVDSDKEDFELKIDYDPEAKKSGIARRPMLLTHSFMMGLALLLIFLVISIIVRQLVIEIKYDRNYLRMALLLAIPIYAGFAGGSAITIVNSFFQLFLPIGDTRGNSRYHSAVAPNPAKFTDVQLPHITIQIPIFKEGLKGVIAPTINSVKAAVRHYESLGGSASIYVNEDGMQVLSPELADARRVFYRDNDVAYCARPPHTGKDGFIRAGRFKKASNMNYALHFSTRVEDELVRLVEERFADRDDGEGAVLSYEEENDLYLQAFSTVLESDEGRTEAAGNVRIGEYILLIDCDTRVPVNCLHMAALELAECPEVAIVQHTSGVLKVAHNLFETGISYLTHLVYTTIRFNVASGDNAVFVGHNAFLRWRAVQSVAFEQDGVVKYWSDEHVSEDWHLSLRLQIAGFQLRLATYHGEEFQEGVSLTIYDEIARWEKYAFGCNELVFNPIHRWYKGPITSLYLRYYFSSVKPSAKLMALSYTFSYYAIASALPLCFVNYMLVGLMPTTLDTFYVTSWKVYLVIIVVFNILAPISYCVIRWRTNQQSLLHSIRQTLLTLPLLVLYFGGLSFHLLKAVFCHFFSIKIEWTATAKELESTRLFVGIDRIFTDFASMYIVLFGLTGGMVYLGVYASVGWTITNWVAILPLANQMACHFLVPIVLAF